MSLFSTKPRRSIDFLGADQLIPRRSSYTAKNHSVTLEDAMRDSVVWACLRLRADLISTMPVDTFRNVDGRAIKMPNSPVLLSPDGSFGGMQEWLYATQVDLDRFGNAYGIITARDGALRPSRIELVPASSVMVRGKGCDITEYSIGGKSYSPLDIWHEKQFVTAGVPIGLSPLFSSALAVNTHLNAQEFIAAWFGGTAVPKSRLKNMAKRVDQKEAEGIRDRYLAMMSDGGLFVHGSDWEFDTIQAAAADSSYLDAVNASNSDACRFYGVPADLIDVASQNKSSVTYASIDQRNLQLLIMNIGPAQARRENALTSLTPAPRYVKLNAAAVVFRMDPVSQAAALGSQIQSRQLAPSEAREIMDRAPFTEEQYLEFDRLWGAKSTPGTKTGVPA